MGKRILRPVIRGITMKTGTTMQLVPRDVHSDFTHEGGVANVGQQQAADQAAGQPNRESERT